MITATMSGVTRSVLLDSLYAAWNKLLGLVRWILAGCGLGEGGGGGGHHDYDDVEAVGPAEPDDGKKREKQRLEYERQDTTVSSLPKKRERTGFLVVVVVSP